MTRGPRLRPERVEDSVRGEEVRIGGGRVRERVVGALPMLFVLALAAAVLVAPNPLSRPGEGRPSEFSAESYAQIVNEGFVPLTWLVRVVDRTTGAPRVALSQEALRHEEVRAFMRSSYLGGDLAAEAADLWYFDGDRVRGINPSAHNLRGPFDAGSGWRGSLAFRDDEGGNGLGEPYLITSRGGEIPLSSRYREREEGGVVSILDGKATGDTERGFEFHDPDGSTVATLQMVGNRPTLTIRCLGSTHDVSISTAGHGPRSCRSAPGQDAAGAASTGEGVTFPLSDEDRILFRMRGAPVPVMSMQLAYGRSFLSRHRPFGPRLSSDAVNGIGEDVARAMDAASARQGPDGGLAARNVVLTLDRALQAQAQTHLTATADGLLKRLGRDDIDLFPAALTVMDATSGELLALATFPQRERLSEATPRSTLARNQNFVALPVGSAAKVPIAGSILGRFPDLRNLCVDGAAVGPDGGGRIDQVLGAALKKPIGDTVTGGTVDFARFLRKSSNRYAAALAILAAAHVDHAAAERGRFVPRFPTRPVPLAAGDGFSLGAGDEACPGARRFLSAPRYVFRPMQETARNGASAYQGVGGLPMQLRDAQGGDSWIDWLQRLFGMDGGTDPRSDVYDASIWQPLIGSSGNRRLDMPFSIISPDRERFGLASAHDLRDYLMVILGGGNARWTAVQLAESFARVVAGREIHAQLVRGGSDISQPLPFRPLAPEARMALIKGMAQVASTDGTARALGAAASRIPVRKGEEIRVFAKTGTPALETPERSPVNRLLNSMIQLRIVILKRGVLEVAARPGENARGALARLAADRRVPHDESVSAALLQRIAQINALRAARQSGGLQFDQSDRLTGIAPDRLGRGEFANAEGGVVALVIGRFCASDAQSLSPLRAASIVVNVQARTMRFAQGRQMSGDNPAVAAAAALLGDAAFRRWLDRRPQETVQCRS